MADRELDKFDPDATCPKCGHDKVGTQYQPAIHSACEDDCRDKKPERLERRCERCRYWWGQSVIEAATGSADRAGREVAS